MRPMWYRPWGFGNGWRLRVVVYTQCLKSHREYDMADITDTGGEYRLQLTGPGLTLDRSVDEARAMRVMAVVMGVRPKPDAQLGAAAGNSMLDPDDAEMTVGEFVDEVDAKRNPDKIATFAAYLKRYRNQPSFTRDDIRPMFEEAGEPVPGNYGRDFRWAVGSKWIASPDNGRTYFITRTGEAAVESHFPTDLVKRSSQGARLKSRKRSSGDGDD